MKHLLIAVILLMSAASAAAQGANRIVSADASRAVNASKDAGTTVGPSTIAPAVPDPSTLEPAAKGEPHTEMLDTANSPEGHDPLLEPQPLPRADLSLIGGIARKVDAVHNRLLLQPFGGGNRYLIYFDERTRILSGGRETTVLAIHPGDRVYVDTQVLGPQVFARTIHVSAAGGSAQASGQVIEVSGGQVRMEDRLSGQTIRLAVSDRTKVVAHGSPASVGDLHSGSLIDVTLTPGKEQSDAQSITILASPGDSYRFAGVLTHVDLSDGVLALDNQTDGNNYELYFDPLAEKGANKLVVGAPVSVIANFDGKRYRATSIKIKDAASDR
jgi:hypothetical protein